MKLFRGVMSVLTAVHLLWAALGALMGLFADGGVWWERIPIVLVHPPAAAALAVLVFKEGPVSKRLKDWVMTLLLVNIAADVLMAALIGAGAVRGDWYLPLTFSVVPAAALPYTWMRRIEARLTRLEAHVGSQAPSPSLEGLPQ